MRSEWTIADRAWRLWDRARWAVRKRGIGGAARKLWRTVRRDWLRRPDPWASEDLDAQYQRWIARHERRARGRRRPGAPPARADPVVTFLCVAGAGDAPGADGCLVASLAEQTCGDWELLLLGDGAAERLAAGWPDARVRVLAAPKGGRAAALTTGLSAARAPFVAVVDAGARLARDAVAALGDALFERPDLDLLYTDEDRLEGSRRVSPRFKPGWSPDLLLSTHYLGRLSVVRRELAAAVGGFRAGFVGAEDYDLALRVAERARHIAHLARVLYHGSASLPAEPSEEGGRRALEAAVERRGLRGDVASCGSGRYRVRYAVGGDPLVSIVIPTRDRLDLLRRCVSSIVDRSSHRRFEIIVVDNASVDPATLAFLRALRDPHRVISYPQAFNWAAINNLAARAARGEQLLFLNNDVEVVTPDWLESMLEHAQRRDVGAVGAKLLYPDGTVQHAGVVIGIGGFADHAFRRLPGDEPVYCGLASMVRDCSAVTGACMMVRREVFEALGGFDERFRVAFNDVDFCLRLRERGYLVVYTPHAVLLHFESLTRGRLHPRSEYVLVRERWGRLVAQGDPYYNPNLTLDREDFGLDL